MRSKIKIIPNKKGFTIVEALIVLAVTGMLFVSTSFLIRGQIEKVRYQDSMRQLQQLVQNTIDDVENGYLINAGTGNTDNLLIGKKFWFCADTYPGAILGCGGTKDNGTLLYTATINQSMTGSSDLSFTNEQSAILPGGLKFIYFKIADDNGNLIWPFSLDEFGSRVMFSDTSGNIGRNATTATTAKLFHREGWPTAVSPTNNLLDHKYILCFEGYKKGSLEIAGVTQKFGNQVALNIEDPRCN